MKIADLHCGESARFLGFHSAMLPTYKRRLLALGLIPGTILTLARKAPLGDPLEIVVRGFSLCLRQHEAAQLRLERLAST